RQVRCQHPSGRPAARAPGPVRQGLRRTTAPLVGGPAAAARLVRATRPALYLRAADPAGRRRTGGDPARGRAGSPGHAPPPPRSLVDRRLLLAWSAPLDPHFTFGPQTRLAGAALVAIPLEFERTAPDTPVTVPAPFLECRRIDNLGNSRRPPTQMAEPVDL